MQILKFYYNFPKFLKFPNRIKHFVDISTFIAPPVSSTNLENPSKHVILNFSTEGLVRFKIFPLANEPREAIRFQRRKFAMESQYISRRSTYR